MNILSQRSWSRDEGESLVRAWRSSGNSLSAFCRERGIARPRLDYWARRTSAASSGNDVGFVAVCPVANNAGFDIRLDRVSVRVEPGFDAVLLRAVIEALS